MSTTHPVEQRVAAAARGVRLLSTLVIVAGLVMLIGGAAAWLTVRDQLGDERVTVTNDAARFAGERVDGPLTAYEQARVIQRRAVQATNGLTYAELKPDDPQRASVMTVSFQQASLFASVVSFGVAAMAMAVGVLLALIGWALRLVARQLTALAQPTP